ncbi:formate dehydrogenase-N subunit alpha [Desulfuribacillus alkaliarsenatis]|uniref:Formate dehydrogenase-N subunit alpha n=3 Tax=Desulfuribacillus alkaliarsenatis TaxID=766136 RepID=A0A1E5FZQ1_9FIRM|nr:formate dehydrogenase-N subunit alpha [Desulfuribacillus alkaliarsenatis]
MTNHWLDLKNAKVFLIQGSNAAENHPMSMKWVMRAKEQGAKVIHVDPRFTRTSKVADIFAQIRAGSDIAFLNAIINYILENDLYDEQFIKDHTNGLLIANEDLAFDNGLFSGYNQGSYSYDTSSWGYELDEERKPQKADSLNDSRCVFSKIKGFFKRYDFKTASDICGVPEETIKLIADTLVENRPGTIMYALGMTQHTVGAQNIRSFGVLQLLLGNVGKPGSGVNALRGEPNVQGATDMACLFHILPGYLATPNHDVVDLDTWTSRTGTFRRTFMVNLLKAWFGENATPENDFGFNWIMKKNAAANYSIFRIFETAIEDQMKMLYIMGQNPMVTSPNLKLVHEALSKMEMLVCADLFMTETAAFWEKPGVDPSTIDTEVIFLPAQSFLEKEGSLSNSGRLVQWRYSTLNQVGEAKSDLEMIDLIFRKVRELLQGSRAEKDQPILNAKWNYSNNHFAEQVLKELNGYDITTGQPVAGIGALRADGTTSSGNWLYAGVFANNENLSKRSDNENDPGGLGIYPGFRWCWPGNIHVLYNRASCDKDGKPYDESKKIVWWDSILGRWTGYDGPDVPNATHGPDTPNGQRAFRMSGEGLGRLIAGPYQDPQADTVLPRDSSGVLVDGPMPEFYEPVESPTTNILHPEVPINPCLKYPRLPSLQEIGTVEDYPYVLCTSSLAEHWCAGTVTRNVPWLNELVKETFIEIPKSLAAKHNIENGDEVLVWSARGEVQAKAMVTHRIKTLMINGKEVETVWMPYNWGYKGLSQAASTNMVTIDAGDPNTWIQETKACLINLRKV